MSKTVKGILLTIIFIPLIGFVSSLYLYVRHLAPMEQESAKVNLEIKPGMTTSQIGALLEEKEIIRSKEAFTWIAEYTGLSGKLKAGEYELDPSLMPLEILDQILEGREVLHMVTIPEGFTVKQTAQVIADSGFSDAYSLIEAASSRKVLDRFGINGRDAEGYLMPETYRFRKQATADEIIGKMLSTFFQKVKPVRDKYQPESALSFNGIVTLASIIEKETANRGEYELISAVFHNRIKKRMLLQADPTVIYALPNFDGNIRKKDLMYDSPYNTYRYRGLPPGPIANPGLDAILAAYQPADESYLYFVATKSEGRHYFSRSLVEHNSAVRKYQLRRRGK